MRRARSVKAAHGGQRKVYRYENLVTPYEKLKSLPDAEKYLKPGISFGMFDQAAHQISDKQAADSYKRPARYSLKPFMNRL